MIIYWGVSYFIAAQRVLDDTEKLLCVKLQETQDMKRMWHQSLQQMPEGVQLIDLDSKEVLFENNTINKLTSKQLLQNTQSQSNDKIRVKKA